MIADVRLTTGPKGDFETDAAFGPSNAAAPEQAAQILPDFGAILGSSRVVARSAEQPILEAVPAVSADGLRDLRGANPSSVPTPGSAKTGKELPHLGNDQPYDLVVGIEQSRMLAGLNAFSEGSLDSPIEPPERLSARQMPVPGQMPVVGADPATVVERKPGQALTALSKVLDLVADETRIGANTQDFPARQGATSTDGKARFFDAELDPQLRQADMATKTPMSSSVHQGRPTRPQAGSGRAVLAAPHIPPETPGQNAGPMPITAISPNASDPQPTHSPPQLAIPPETAASTIARPPASGLEGLVRDAGQIETLIENLLLARESGRQARGEMQLRHEDFGLLAVKLASGDGDTKAIVSSRDPGFALAAQQALGDRAVQQVADSGATSPRNHDQQSGQANHSNHRTTDAQTNDGAGPDPQSPQAMNEDHPPLPGEQPYETDAHGGPVMPARGLFA